MMDRSLLEKYFAGGCEPAELKEVLDWLNDAGEDHTLLQAMMEEHWEESYRIEHPRRRWYWVAASVAVLLVLGGGLALLKTRKEEAPAWSTVSNMDTHIEYAVLPDGTRVWLDPHSSISYNMGRERSVRLEGQAFFDVARDGVRPFVAYGGAVSVRVLGTAFDMEAYANEKDVRVSLVKGKVAITMAGDRVLLTGGEMLTCTPGTGRLRKEVLKELDMADWTGGHLVFNDVPVRVALDRLCALYGLRLAYGEGVRLEGYRFSTVFTGENRDQMIRNILFITGYTYRLEGNTVMIVRKK